MKQKKILLINDMAGYGKVATAAMLPILSYMGHPTYNLPTALVSNTLDYGLFRILDTTDYIRSVFPVWRKLGFSFDAIATGFMTSVTQARMIADYCRAEATKGTPIFVDPIMGDEGRLYNGVTDEAVESMRALTSVADLVYPNYTEACLLAGVGYKAEGVTEPEAYALVDAIRAIGTPSALITSIRVDGEPSVVGYNARGCGHFRLTYEEIPVHFPGTGDIFSAVLIGRLLGGDPLTAATRRAMDAVYMLIDRNKDNEDKNAGIPVEKFLAEI